MRSQSTTRVLNVVLAATFWVPGYVSAQSAAPSGPEEQTSAATPQTQSQPSAGAAQPATGGQPQSAQPKPPASGTTVNPSQAPLQPVTTYPDASGKAQAGTVPEAPQPQPQKPKGNEPQGAATAERVPTAGASAAKPAGVAIAPAKQHRTRSLLIKFGAVAAAGVAAGTIYALSRGTSSTPPGTSTPGAVPK